MMWKIFAETFSKNILRVPGKGVTLDLKDKLETGFEILKNDFSL